jgi:peptidoglycan hydrolase-like protein with peptidoglycan-binding domain
MTGNDATMTLETGDDAAMGLAPDDGPDERPDLLPALVADPSSGAAVPLVRRRRTLLAVLGVAVLVAAAGVTSPLWIKSPQQLAADAKPPAPTVLTAPVERKTLRDVVVLRGELKPSQAFEVTPASRTGSKAVVTAVKVKQGDLVDAGTVALEASGRPFIVLPGATPAFRDLKPGATGRDVTQLQAALASLGQDPREHDGTFGPGTKRALTSFYSSRGYTPVPVSEDDQKQVDALRKQVTAAERQVSDAREAAAALRGDANATPQQKAQADKAVTRATEDLTTARRDLTDVERTTGAMLPQSEYTFLPSFPARVDALKAVVGAEVATPLVTFSTGDLVVRASLTAAQHDLCKPGATVEIVGDDGLTAKGTVTTIGPLETGDHGDDGGSAGADKSGGGGAATGPPGYPVTVTPAARIDPRYSGQNVRVSIEAAASTGDELVVPVSAIYGAADGQVYVTRRSRDGHEQRIVVEPVLGAQGYVVVKVKDGQLSPGDLVTVGTGKPG